MSDYPSAVYEPRTKTNKEGVTYAPEESTKIFAEDINNLDGEVVAIETELGASPKGDYASVAERLNDILRLARNVVVAGRIYMAIWFESISSWTVSKSTTSTVLCGIGNMVLKSGNTTNYYAEITPVSISGGFYPPFFNQAPRFETYVKIVSSVTQTIYFGLGRQSGDFIGFKIVDGTLYAMVQTINPANEDLITTLEEITGITITTQQRFSAEFDGIDTVRFYIDDILKKTITGQSNLVEEEYNNQTAEFYAYIKSGTTQYRYLSFKYVLIDSNL
jgi:hypothetical protein